LRSQPPGAASSYLAAAYSRHTRRAYDADWRHFTAWCERHAARALPADPGIVAGYLTALAEGARAPDGHWLERPRALATLARRLAAIRQYHRAAGLPFDARDPTLHATWHGIQRVHAAAPRAKVPTVTELLRALVAVLPSTAGGVRDRALLLVGFAGAMRRAELVAIDLAHCAWHVDGLVITIAPLDAPPDAAAEDVGLPYGEHPETCPVRAMAHWLATADIAEGPVFRPGTRHGTVVPHRLSGRAVALVIKRAVGAAQASARAQGNSLLAESLDPGRYAGHSLRAGFIVSAAAAGVPEVDIMRQSRHKRADALHKYVRQAAVFRQNAAARVGL
jgi:integrase